MIEIQGKIYPRKTQEIQNLCNLVEDNKELRKNFKVKNMAKFKKFLQTRSFALISSAVKALEHSRSSHQLFGDWLDYVHNYHQPKLRIVKKFQTQLMLF